MLPASFEYHAPRSVDEALDLLDQFGDEGKVLAGGQSLIPLLKLRFASPGHLVDINRSRTWTLSRSVTAPCGSARCFATRPPSGRACWPRAIT